MNKRTWMAGLSVLAAMAMIFTACGASSGGASSSAAVMEEMGGGRNMMAFDMAAPQEAPSATDAVETEKVQPDTGGAAVPQEERKIVKYCTLEMETMEFDQALEDIVRIVEEAGGYIQNQEVGGRSFYNQGEYYERNASISARIPADQLDAVTESVGGLCNVVSKNESMDDITDSYYDAQARLDTLKLQEERLLDILSKAEKLEDVITLEQALSDVRYQIESLTASLKRMDSQVTYSYLNLNLREVVEYNLLKNQPKTFWDKLQASGARSLENISGALQGILFFVIEDLPVMLIFAALIGLIAWIVVRISKKIASRRPPQPPRPPYVPPMQGGFQKYPAPQSPQPPTEEKKEEK